MQLSLKNNISPTATKFKAIIPSLAECVTLRYKESSLRRVIAENSSVLFQWIGLAFMIQMTHFNIRTLGSYSRTH